jgi:hypothetical protein
MESRNFKLDTEWNMIHYPEKPKGFGVLIIGDERHFVDENSSFWTQNEGKQSFIQTLRDAGYTIFYSNLYGKNWGSDKAVQLAKRLYEYIVRTEIINQRIHLIAEGMGALVAIKLLVEMGGNIRSAVFLNPVLSLKHHLEQEKEHKFFYKKLVNELSISYGVEKSQVVEVISKNDHEFPVVISNIPVKIIHVLSGNRAYKQSNLLRQLSVKWRDDKAPITVSYMVPEKKKQIEQDVTRFFKGHEAEL